MYIAVGEDLWICHKNFAFQIFVFVDFIKLQLSRVSNDAVSIQPQQVCDVLHYKRKAAGEERGIDAFYVGTLGSLIGSPCGPTPHGEQCIKPACPRLVRRDPYLHHHQRAFTRTVG